MSARLLLLTALLALAAPARAALRVETGGALALPDPALADFRWDLAPRAALSLGAGLESAHWSLGVAGARTTGRQGTGLPAGPAALALELRSVELRLARRLAAPWRNELWLRGTLGRLRIAYEPAGLTIDFGDGEPLTVDFAAIDAWYAGGGLELRRSLGAAFALGLDLDLRLLALDSARRLDTDLVHARERFRDLRLGLRLHWYPGRFGAAPIADKEEPA